MESWSEVANLICLLPPPAVWWTEKAAILLQLRQIIGLNWMFDSKYWRAINLIKNYLSTPQYPSMVPSNEFPLSRKLWLDRRFSSKVHRQYIKLNSNFLSNELFFTVFYSKTLRIKNFWNLTLHPMPVEDTFTPTNQQLHIFLSLLSILLFVPTIENGEAL